MIFQKSWERIFLFMGAIPILPFSLFLSCTTFSSFGNPLKKTFLVEGDGRKIASFVVSLPEKVPGFSLTFFQEEPLTFQFSYREGIRWVEGKGWVEKGEKGTPLLKIAILRKTVDFTGKEIWERFIEWGKFFPELTLTPFGEETM